MKKTWHWIAEILILLSRLLITSILIFVGKIGLVGFISTILIFYLINTIISILIFINERNHETKISWLVFIIMVPIIGQIIFIILGRKSVFQETKIQYENSFKEFANNKIKTNEISAESYLEKKMSSLVMRSWKKSSFEIYNHGFEAYESLFNDIKKAKHHIHIEMYIMKPSETYDKFKSILLKKVEEGIEVKIMIDDFGKWSFSDNEIVDMKNAGIQIEVFNKIKFPFLNIKQSFRSHRKVVIIDGNIVHTGGINISDEYSSFDKKYGYWVDVNARVTGDICNDFSQLFLYSWFKLTKVKLDSEKYIIKQNNELSNSKSLFFEEGPNVVEYFLEKSLMNCITFATKKIRIATPYFIPSKKILDQFKFALHEGVEVEIFIPGLADKKYILEATHLYLKELILNGAKVYEMKNMFLHSKIGSFDNSFGYLGTVNWDMRTLYSNYESLNFITGDAVTEIDLIFDDYKKYSTLVVVDSKKRKFPTNLFKVFLIKLLSPLM